MTVLWLPGLFLPFCLLPFSLSLTTDIQKKQPGDDCTSKPIQSTGSSQSSVFSSETSSSSSQSMLSSPPSNAEQPSAQEPSPPFPITREGKLGRPDRTVQRSADFPLTMGTIYPLGCYKFSVRGFKWLTTALAVYSLSLNPLGDKSLKGLRQQVKHTMSAAGLSSFSSCCVSHHGRMMWEEIVPHVSFSHLQACRPQKQPRAHSAHPQNVHENRVQSASFLPVARHGLPHLES